MADAREELLLALTVYLERSGMGRHPSTTRAILNLFKSLELEVRGVVQ